MDLVIAAGPGNGKELMDHLAWTAGARVKLAWRAEEIHDADLIVTPRGPSRSFSKWYQTDPVGQAVLQAYQQGTPWLAFCGSGLPLCSKLGAGCHGIEPLSLIAATGTNDRCHGPGIIRTVAGKEYPFHFTSAPSFSPMADSDCELIATAKNGECAILRSGDLVVSSGIPATKDGWAFLFETMEIPISGAKA